MFVICINPLLQALERELRGLKMRTNGTPAKLVAYADDVTLILTSPEEIEIAGRLIGEYELASGAKVNVRKSKALALSTWDTTVPILDMPYT
jgi:hypothetical protein